ncbi:unnamed protein product, partial [Ectocarpus sp. 12 AP-2014]
LPRRRRPSSSSSSSSSSLWGCPLPLPRPSPSCASTCWNPRHPPCAYCPFLYLYRSYPPCSAGRLRSCRGFCPLTHPPRRRFPRKDRRLPPPCHRSWLLPPAAARPRPRCPNRTHRHPLPASLHRHPLGRPRHYRPRCH